jgi:hypothetical protein
MQLEGSSIVRINTWLERSSNSSYPVYRNWRCFWTLVICLRKFTTSRPRRTQSSLSDLIKRYLISQSAKNAVNRRWRVSSSLVPWGLSDQCSAWSVMDTGLNQVKTSFHKWQYTHRGAACYTTPSIPLCPELVNFVCIAHYSVPTKSTLYWKHSINFKLIIIGFALS